jgi:hypothetical protein
MVLYSNFCYPFLGSRTKNEKIQKKYISRKIYAEGIKKINNNNNNAGTPIKWLEIG